MECLYQTLPLKAQGNALKGDGNDCKGQMSGITQESSVFQKQNTDTHMDSQRQ